MIEETENVGEILRRTREAKGVSLEDIARRSNISSAYLLAIEENRFDRLPHGVFVRSFVGQYARLVGLEPEEVVELYRRQMEGTSPGGRLPVVRGERSAWKWVFLVTVFLLAVAAVLWVWLGHRGATSVSSPAPAAGGSVLPAAERPVPADPEVERTSEVVLSFSRECWVSVTLDGKRIFEGIKLAGDDLRYTVRESLSFRVGDGGAVSVTKDGTLWNLDSREGQPVDTVITVEEPADDGSP